MLRVYGRVVKAVDCKSIGESRVGSNPTAPNELEIVRIHRPSVTNKMAQPTASLLQRSNVSQVAPMSCLAKYGSSGSSEPLGRAELNDTLIHQLVFTLVNSRRLLEERRLQRALMVRRLGYLKRPSIQRKKLQLIPKAKKVIQQIRLERPRLRPIS